MLVCSNCIITNMYIINIMHFMTKKVERVKRQDFGIFRPCSYNVFI